MKIIGIGCICLLHLNLISQKLPQEMSFISDGRRLVSGLSEVTGLYNPGKIKTLELQFDQPNYWTLLTNNYQSKTDIPATLTYDGVIYNNVGVRFKGQTSYQRVTSQKKSFNITLDFMDPAQNLKGYETLNLNNSYEDNSYIREILYENITRPFCPSLKANFVHLFINGQDWGLYPNVQALDGDYIEEWFLSNEGSRWRCERQGGPGGPGGGGFGAGTSSLNYLGDDTTTYKTNYNLKKSTLDNPWDDLVKVTKVLNTIPLIQLEDSLNKVMDIDRTLWFLAKEILLGDDDSYVNKGGMDYYAIYQKDVERLIPLEYDANSVMKGQTANWSPFLKETDTRFPLCNRLFSVPAIRQRYLAHFRSLANIVIDTVYFKNQVESFYSLIDSLVYSDPKKLMTYSAFLSEKNTLYSWMRNRRNFILNNAEFKQSGNAISDVMFSTTGIPYKTPDETQSVTVTAKVTGQLPPKEVNLYFAPGYDGKFSKAKMWDDGNHDDGAGNDGIYGGVIPSFLNGVFIRYYVEAIANNIAMTASYMPEGAEHDVYIYQVNLESSSNNSIVINELMASNTNTVADQDGEFDDWIELFNKSEFAIDITDWILTDNPSNLDKYRVPAGTIMLPHSYLIIWADEDGKQNGFHANFKLSASGEELFLLDPDGLQVDKVSFGQQVTDKAYARKPNGTGSFVIQDATFNKNNDGLTRNDNPDIEKFSLYPNPAHHWLSIQTKDKTSTEFRIVDALGNSLLKGNFQKNKPIDVSELYPGIYVVILDGQTQKLVIH